MRRINLNAWLVMSVFVLAMVLPAAGKTILVDCNAPGPVYDGSSWPTAFKYLQDGLTAASSGDEIQVAEGIYKPDEDSANPSGTGNREATFQLKNGVPIKGGYAGFGQPDPDARDIELYETILSGDLLGNDGPNFAKNDENSYHVVRSSGTDATAVLDGFTITSGNAEDYPSPPNPNHEMGGGMYNDHGSPTVTNCTFSKNSASWKGGGMCNSRGSPTLINCTFSGNSSGQDGGGIENRASSLTVINCTFSGNSAVWGGGGMANRDSSPTVTNCMFTDNTARVGGGMRNSYGSATVENCIFIGNSAGDWGGGMTNHDCTSSLTVTNCTFTDNSAKNGGGMFNVDGSPTLTDCTFSRNLASDFGGGMINIESSPTVTNCTFNNNSAEWGGGMENESNSNLSLIDCTFKANSATIGGGAIRNHTSGPTVLNCLIVGNQALAGAGIHNENSSNPTLINCTLSGNSATYWGGGIINYNSSPILNNCILWANNDDGGTDESAQIHNGVPAVNNCCIQGWTGNLGGFGNIYADPWFIQPGYWNAHGAWIDGDYHLHRGSPCINTGDNSAVPPSVSTDLDGNPRIAAGTVDMGAYEDHSVPVIIYVQANASGENNGSGWADAFNDLQNALAEAQSGDEIRVARGAYSPEGPLPDIRRASNPNPMDGSFGVNTNADLSWTAGPDATSHDVYFGTTRPPPFMQNQTGTTFDPGTMDYYTTYYWRIDEVGPSGTTTGTIWSFTTLSAPPPPPPLANSNEQAELDRTSTFQLKNGVVIKGGYAGFGEPDPNARNIKVYETILSGDIGIPGNNSDNSYTVVTGSGADATAVLDGFTITAGNADGNYPDSFGGGGMYNISGSPTIDNCTFSGNTATYGGAVFNDEYSSPKLTNCIFRQNVADSGGAMYNDMDSSPTLTNCIFSRNLAIYNDGGGMVNISSSPTLINCTFSANSAGFFGGGMYYVGGNVTLTNCAFLGNLAGLFGGGMFNVIWNTKSSLTMTNCTFSGNSAFVEGGAVYTDRGIPTLTNCILWGNSPQEVSGAGSPSVTYSDVQGGYPGEGNIDANPCFVVPEYLGPMAYWKLDEAGGTKAYDSVGSNHGNVYGALWTDGLVDGALSFDGLNDYVSITENYEHNNLNEITLEAWIYPRRDSHWHVLDKGDGDKRIYAEGTTLTLDGRVRYTGEHAFARSVSHTLSLNTWQHVALTWSRADNTTRLYHNGVETHYAIRTIGTGDVLDDRSHRWTIGARGALGEVTFFDGLIDEAAIYNRVLSPEEIRENYLAGLSGQGYPGIILPDCHLLEDSPCINTGDPDYVPELNETDLDGKPRVIAGRIDMGAYEFNHNPIADAGQDQTVEAQAPWGTIVTLDGSGSSDADCAPGTYDDINDFDWYVLDPCDPNADVLLGTGRIIDCKLPIGEHVILLEVIDRAGASDTNEVTILVQDTTPPDINCPPDVTLEYPADTSPSATGKATAADTCGDVTVRCRNRIIPACGNTKTIERTWTATDESGNSSTCVQIITVVDTTPPVITCPPDVTLECPADTSVEANGSATASDTCGTVTMTHSDLWQPDCGNTGILTRTWTATDECGNSSSCVQTITVVDTTPPEFQLSVAPTMLWPPDHKMVLITPSWTVNDECDTTPDVSLVGIVANEGDNTIGDGHTTDDIQIGEDGSIYLRSERSGTGNDRIYTITYQAVDDCGNTTIRSATVSIPHDFKVLARIASRWLWSGPAGRIPEDLNGDGIVNLADVARFAGNWTK